MPAKIAILADVLRISLVVRDAAALAAGGRDIGWRRQIDARLVLPRAGSRGASIAIGALRHAVAGEAGIAGAHASGGRNGAAGDVGAGGIGRTRKRKARIILRTGGGANQLISRRTVALTPSLVVWPSRKVFAGAGPRAGEPAWNTHGG